MSDNATLTADQVRSLRCLAGMMIPASSTYNVPSAADDTIFADILRSFGRDAAQVREAMRMLDDLAGGRFAELDATRREAVAARFRDIGGEPLKLLTHIILQCYYRDDRVMRSLDMEVRPPFPKGFEVEQGDWSLLDPVRKRGKLYREAG
ncbi:MAG TPA: hypothetical protein VME47_16395 [Acetobacteraceae bacterium]|nr:hypothetical protein [Acetobacteraceae bacterium]